MPSVCVRNPPARNTLPRPVAKRKTIQKTPIRPSSNNRRSTAFEDDDLDTPRASTYDVRNQSNGGGSCPQSMTSSIVGESRDSSNPSPSEARDTVSDFVPLRQFRCVPRSTKAKRIRFYRNGDQYYKGLVYALHTDRVRSMKPLMEDLARTMGDSQNLPHGIRHIFTIDGQYRITEVDQFEDGEAYVCSSTEVFKQMDYANAKEPAWCSTLSRGVKTIDAGLLGLTITDHVNEPTDFVEPRIITVIRNGLKPRRVIRHLLNKKTARSFDQVMRDLTEVVKLDSGAVRKLFDLSGKQVTCLRDFFGSEHVFIAYGNEKHTADDFSVGSEEFKRLNVGRSAARSRNLRRVMPSRNESLREDRCGSVIPDEYARDLPGELNGVFEITKLLGDGNTALVYEVVETNTSERKALKIIARENTIDKEFLIKSELAIMRRICHENVVQMYDHWEIAGSHYISLELVDGGDLFEYLRCVQRIPETTAADLTRCLAEALRYLHDSDIVHRDVKPENLLLYQDGSGNLALKLADFGLATELPDDGGMLTVICGTPTYVAAEVLTEQGYDERVDIWATGIILYVMLCGFPPFESSDGSQEELFRQILQGKFNFPSPSWDEISWTVKHLIFNLVVIDMDNRLAASEILQNNWVKNRGAVIHEEETMAEFAVQSRLDGEEFDVSQTDREYYCSRRNSEMSEREFVFKRGYS